MKYGYEEKSYKELIENYKVSGDKIVITFLDGTKNEILLTKENERELLSKMIKQAQERSESSALYIAKIRKKTLTNFVTIIMGGILLDFAIVSATTAGNSIFMGNVTESIAAILGSITGLCIVIGGIQYSFNDEIEELEKYNIYLSIRDELEKCISDFDLFSGVEKMTEKFNINTLDEYTLEDLIQISNNLKRYKEISSMPLTQVSEQAIEQSDEGKQIVLQKN